MVADERVQAERELVRELATRLLAGESLNALVRDLDARGWRTVAGNPWTAPGLRQLLLRPSLAGHVEYRGQLVGRLEGEPVLDPDVWESLVALFASRRRGRPISGTYLLSGLLRCGRCGATLVGRPRTSGRPYPDGEVRREYWCSKRGPGNGCGSLAVDQRFADLVVERAVLERLGDPRHVAQVEAQLAASNEVRDRIAAELTQVESTLTRLDDRLAAGELSLDRWDRITPGVQAKVDRLRAELAEVEAQGPSPSAGADVEGQWRHGSVQARRQMVRDAFPRLTVRPATGRGVAARDDVGRFDWDGATLVEPLGR
jgi:site-specific DNA recombinase